MPLTKIPAKTTNKAVGTMGTNPHNCLEAAQAAVARFLDALAHYSTEVRKMRPALAAHAYRPHPPTEDQTIKEF